MTQSRKLWNVAISCMTGVAESCRSICQGDGWPRPANAAPALASKIPKTSAVALNRDNPGIALATCPDHGPYWRCRRRAANTCDKYMFIKYMFIVQRYGLMPAAAGGFLHRECGL